MDFNLLKNTINIILNNQKQDKKNHGLLVYQIQDIPCFPENTEYVANSENYKTKELLEYLEKVKNKQGLKSIFISQVKITNVGNEIIKGTDFFNESKLRINNCNYYLGFIDPIYTKEYIGAKIVRHKNYEYFIDFDCIKPHDTIVVSFVAEKKISGSYTRLFGETAYFNSILPANDLYEYYNKLRKEKITKIVVCIISSIIILSMLFCTWYCQKNNVVLVIKKNAQTQGVNNAK